MPGNNAYIFVMDGKNGCLPVFNVSIEKLIYFYQFLLFGGRFHQIIIRIDGTKKVWNKEPICILIANYFLIKNKIQ